MSNHLKRQIEAIAAKSDVRFEITIQHLHSGQTRLKVTNSNRRLCKAMLADALQIIDTFKDSADLAATGPVIVAPNGEVVSGGG